jgi:hypothetical protein
MMKINLERKPGRGSIPNRPSGEERGDAAGTPFHKAE